MTMPSVRLTGDVGQSIDVKLKSSWTYDESERLFRGPRGKTIELPEWFAQGVDISHKVPQFLGRSQKQLTRAERDLGRYLQVKFPKTLDLKNLIDSMSKLPSIETAALAPQCELPKQTTGPSMGIPSTPSKP